MKGFYKKALIAFLVSIPIMGMTNNQKYETVTTDEYSFKMKIKIPRIYDNNKSLGYRKYQSQNIQGTLKISYRENENDNPIIRVSGLVNKTHKINGKNITYSTLVDNGGEYVFPRIAYVGDNKTNKFKTPCIIFYIDAEPSYNIGEDEPDNTLLLFISGVGKTKDVKWYSCGKTQIIYSFSGGLTGTLGCGCRAYGHKSPTRTAGIFGATANVTDIASVYGTWTAKFQCRRTERIQIE